MALKQKKLAALAALGAVIILGAILYMSIPGFAPEEDPTDEAEEIEVTESETETETAEEEAAPENERPEAPLNRANILLLGFDERGLADAIVIVSYDIKTFETAFISLKRDTYVDFQTWSPEGSGHSAIGWASYVGMDYGAGDHESGAKYLAETIEELLEIRITSYAGITFAGFVELIDSLGGVSIDVDPLFAERSSNPLPTGRQRLSGEEALVYARHRQNPRIPEPGSQSEDGDRVRRNQKLLQAVFDRLRDLSSEELLETYDHLEERIHTNMNQWDLMTLANIFYNKDPELIDKVVLPGQYETVYEEDIDQDIDYYYLDEDKCAELLQELGLK